MQAHKPSDSYLTLTVSDKTIAGRWDIALRDLDNPLILDADGNGVLTWGEVRVREADIKSYAFTRIKLTGDGRTCAIHPGDMLIDHHSDGTYAVLEFDVACPTRPTLLGIDYRLFADVDTLHKGLVHVVSNGATTTAILGLSHPTEILDIRGKGVGRAFIDFIGEGMWHIWRGFDHALFLLSLMLPAACVLHGKKWFPADSPGAVSIDVLKLVTAFTAAHAITLSLATLHVVALPSRWVEIAIAVTILLSALNNIVPLVRRRRWLVAFSFGLIHGFGFASVLTDMALPRSLLAAALAGFNIGVELGQISLVLLLLPILYIYRSSRWFRLTTLYGGSAAISVFATLWIYERTTGLTVLAL
ncbi:HupE/UreJ family protein [Paraburkholderia sp. SIMBA_030]|uniref:HupE/UreJ family protein n=1 Tax=Paraburkholderia sp. SIMBA_030 TaxID=3085773 RepID=UPI00397C3437